MNAVSNDVNFLDELPAKTLLGFMSRKQTFDDNAAKIARTIREAAPLFRELERMDADLTCYSESGFIALRLTGDGDKLGEAWGALRRAGYTCADRPKAGKPQFSAFWQHATHFQIFMMFTSAVCRRIQVGTQMVEQPIYKIQCGELPELDSPDTALTMDVPA